MFWKEYRQGTIPVSSRGMEREFDVPWKRQFGD